MYRWQPGLDGRMKCYVLAQSAVDEIIYVTYSVQLQLLIVRIVSKKCTARTHKKDKKYLHVFCIHDTIKMVKENNL